MIDASNDPLGKFPWGCQDEEYKKQMTLLKREGENVYFTYEKVPPARIPSQDDISKLWTSVPYDRNKNMLLALTEEELQGFPGLKQHVPHEDTELETHKDEDYKDRVKSENSYHRMNINKNITTKTGPGPKFFNDGCNLCNNAVITRFDEHGNIQMMAMKRPENASSDAGEYQMSAGCLFFGGNGHTIKVDNKEYHVERSIKYNIAEGPENVDDDGKLKGEAKAHAIASILEKLWTDEKSKDIVETFDFHLLSKGIVDDTSNTRHRWVETSYVIHHITGSEDLEVLEHLKDSKVNPKRANVGDGVWRSIELNPKGKVYSQVSIEENNEYKKVWVEHDESSQVYDPATEFEFWHGDHSVVAARICEYVSSNYRFRNKGECGFGVSEPLDDPVKQKVWEIENLLDQRPKANLDKLHMFSSVDKDNQQQKSWSDIKGKITSIQHDGSFCRSVLEYETGVRTIEVMKDLKNKEGDYDVHRKYTAKDSLFQKILRRNPPDDVQECLAVALPTYKASLKLFKIVEKTSLLDDRWNKFTGEFDNFCREDGSLSKTEIKNVFLIRHTCREDTILSLCARKNVPLAIIELIYSKAGRESVCVVDCIKWDWIPMQYAIFHNARPEVVKALIPTLKDCSKESSQLSDYHICVSKNPETCEEYEDIIFKADFHYRNPLHWAAYYNAPLETIAALKDACSNTTLLMKDHCGHEPYKTAIWHGRSTTIIEALFLKHESLPYKNFEDVLAKYIRTLIYNDKKCDDKKCDDKKCDDKKCDDKKCDKDTNEYYQYHQGFDIDSISAEIAESPRLQKILAMKSCEPLTTFIVMADFYSSIYLIRSYHMSISAFLSGQDVILSQWLPYVIVSISYKALREISQMLAEHVRWFFSVWNYFDVANVVLVYTSVFQMRNGGYKKENPETITLIVIITSLVWLNFIVFLRSTFMPFASFVGGISRIISDLIPFIVISLLILMAFGAMFRLTLLEDNGECKIGENRTEFDYATDFCSLQDSLFIAYGLFVQGIDLNFSQSSSNTTMVFSFLVVVILFNVMIAIVSEAWAQAVKESKQVFWAYRLTFLMEVQRRQGIFIFIKSRGGEKIPGESSFEKRLHEMDERLSQLCKFFWPSKDYWGHFESIFQRMFSHDIGSFKWQCIYESKNGGRWKRIQMGFKVTVLLIVFGFCSTLWFTLGLLSFGILWPRSIKHYFLASAMEKRTSGSKKGEEDALRNKKGEEDALRNKKGEEDALRNNKGDNHANTDSSITLSTENSNHRNDALNKTLRKEMHKTFEEFLRYKFPEEYNNGDSLAILGVGNNAPPVASAYDNNFSSTSTSSKNGTTHTMNVRKRRIDSNNDDNSTKDNTPTKKQRTADDSNDNINGSGDDNSETESGNKRKLPEQSARERRSSSRLKFAPK